MTDTTTQPDPAAVISVRDQLVCRREVAMTDLTVTHIQADVRVHKPGRRPTWDAYRVGWLPGEGWFCDCPAPRACTHLTAVRDAVAALDDTKDPR